MGSLERNEGYTDMQTFEEQRLQFWDIGKQAAAYFADFDISK